MRPARTLLIIPLFAACYVYHPTVGTNAPAGQRIRLTLTDSGTANLASQVGPSTEALAGRLVDDSAGNYLVSLLETRKRGGVETGWSGERVAIPRPLVARVEVRRFSRTRTLLTCAAVVAGTVIARDAFWGPGRASGGAPSRPGPAPR